jgi:hypothetical protein
LLPLVLITGGAGYLFSFIFEQKIILSNPLNGEYKINRALNEPHPDEIAILGSSRAAYVFIPDSLGPDYFNYGLAGTRYDVTLFFLEQKCRQRGTRNIILNLDLEGLGYGVGDVSNYIMNSDNPEVKTLLGSEYRPWFNIPFIKYFGRYENFFRLYLSNKLEFTKFTNKGAAIEKDALSEKEFNEMVVQRRNTRTTFHNEPALEKRLLDLVDFNSKIKFLFVVSPYHSSYFDNFTNPGDAQAFLAKLSEKANVKVLDYSKLPMADSMFLNTTHINLKGAILFNHLLRDTLNGILAK